ncbi:hypothetical protein FACS1894122_00910 [Alphaproteobacteria bacterium]|nr:hypothetical protein FACS1894122_00910 [Alphaproteobacteria bacterium]
MYIRSVAKPTMFQRDIGGDNDETRMLQTSTTKIPNRERLRNRAIEQPKMFAIFIRNITIN